MPIQPKYYKKGTNLGGNVTERSQHGGQLAGLVRYQDLLIYY